MSVIRSNSDGSQVLLKDVARVELGSQIYNTIGRLDGAPAAILAVYQLPGSNGLQVAANIRATMDSIAAAADVSVGTVYNYFGTKNALLLEAGTR